MATVKLGVITIDVEPDHAGWLKYSFKGIEEGLPILLEFFEDIGLKATFFVTYDVAEKFPRLIRKIWDFGNELAVHGIHRDLNVANSTSTLSDVRRDAQKTRDMLSSISEEDVYGYRAAYSTMNPRYLLILEKLGFLYDSSIIPSFRPKRYYYISAPREPYFPSQDDLCKRGNMKILEIPVSTISFLRAPMALSYMEFLGFPFFRFIFSIFGTRFPLIFYLHPFEIVNSVNDGLPWRVRHVYFRNKGQKAFISLWKFIELLGPLQVTFVTMKELSEMYTDKQSGSGGKKNG
jgi:peptidoglycan/xylan/chitin deacetylase (PgdA/CDA1 family)